MIDNVRDVAAAEAVYASPESQVNSWLGFASDVRSGLLHLEPDEIKQWLANFEYIIAQIAQSNAKLQIDATDLATAFGSLGEFPPSQQIAAKIADRLGASEGGLAWVIDDVAKRLDKTYLALRESLNDTVINDEGSAGNLTAAGDGH